MQGKATAAEWKIEVKFTSQTVIIKNLI